MKQDLDPSPFHHPWLRCSQTSSTSGVKLQALMTHFAVVVRMAMFWCVWQRATQRKIPASLCSVAAGYSLFVPMVGAGFSSQKCNASLLFILRIAT